MPAPPLTPEQTTIIAAAWAEGLHGRDKLYQKLKREHPEAKISFRQVAAYLRTNPAHQLYLPQRKTLPVAVVRRGKPLGGLEPVHTAPQPALLTWGHRQHSQTRRAVIVSSGGLEPVRIADRGPTRGYPMPRRFICVHARARVGVPSTPAALQERC